MTLDFRSASALGALALATMSFQATAQIDGYPCNGSPGEQQVGVAPPLGTPICARAPANGTATQASAPVQDSNTALANLYQLEAKDREEKLKRLIADPRFKTLVEGYWLFVEPSKNGAASDFPCIAKFMQIRGAVSLIAQGGPHAPLVGTVEGPAVPRPTKPREIKVDISQNGSAPVSVKMFNYASPGDALGTLEFNSGNNLQQALGAMQKEESEMKIDFEGKTIFEGGYRKGSEMKERFAKCVTAMK